MTTRTALLLITGIVTLVAASLVVMRNRQQRGNVASQAVTPSPQVADSLADEMAKLQVHTALVVQSLLIKGFPAWSPDSRFLGVMLQGQWFKLDTNRFPLEEGEWHGQRIGVIRPDVGFGLMTVGEAADWTKAGQHGDREVKGKSGMKATIRYHDASSTLLISQGARTSAIWEADLENCGALTLSPSGSYLAYTCDESGLFVMDVGQVTRELGKRRNSHPPVIRRPSRAGCSH